MLADVDVRKDPSFRMTNDLFPVDVPRITIRSVVEFPLSKGKPRGSYDNVCSYE